MDNKVIDQVYLPFTTDQLREHFAPIRNGQKADPDRHLTYYLKSAENYRRHRIDCIERRGQPLSALRTPCQIEKDERFWVAACLMTYYHAPARAELLGRLLTRIFGPVPPLVGAGSWKDFFDGDLKLFFEVGLPAPPLYKGWLRGDLSKNYIIPYVFDAAHKRDTDIVRVNLEGPTHVDAMLVNDRGFAVLIEAKVLSDASYQISFDARRNQIARNIDVMLDRHPKLPGLLGTRDPDKSLFVMLTPQMFKDEPHSRLYGWLFKEYTESPETLGRDLQHRGKIAWDAVARRIGWLTWEDCEAVLKGSCSWLPIN
jgi:hypothetical protein